MTTTEKKAIMRIISDLVKADTVIDTREISLWEKAKEKYRINKEILIESQKISFSQAIKILRGLDSYEKALLLNDLKEIAGADGNCCQSEAIIILATELCLSEEYRFSTDISHSDPFGDQISSLTVAYIESSYDEDTNNQIQNNYQFIKSAFKLAGFDFVYIPAVTDKFKKMNPTFLNDFIECIAPCIDPSNCQKIYEKLTNTTTVEFCTNLLFNKLSLSFVEDTDPAFLIKIGNSMVSFAPTCTYEDCENKRLCENACVQAFYPEYVKYNIGADILADVNDIAYKYKKLISTTNITIKNNNFNDEFYYSGFMKSFFDLLAFPGKLIESRIIINPLHRKIDFKDLGEKLNATAFLRAFFVFLVYAQVSGKVIDRNEKSADKRNRYQKLFNKIYQRVGKPDSEAPSYLNDMSQTLAKLRSIIRKIELLKNKRLYEPTSENDIVSVKIDPMKVFVIDSKTGNEKLMLESPEWMDLGKL